MTTYWAILEKVRGSSLRLTKMDDDIYEHLKKDFPEFDPAATINEDEMKSKSGKERWRKFMMAYEKKIDDYNFGTIMRLNPKMENDQDTTIFGRIFLMRLFRMSLTGVAQFLECNSMPLRLQETKTP
jgi:Polysaccharide biosynthesis